MGHRDGVAVTGFLWNTARRPEPVDLVEAQRLWDEVRREEGLADCLADPEAEGRDDAA